MCPAWSLETRQTYRGSIISGWPSFFFVFTLGTWVCVACHGSHCRPYTPRALLHCIVFESVRSRTNGSHANPGNHLGPRPGLGQYVWHQVYWRDLCQGKQRRMCRAGLPKFVIEAFICCCVLAFYLPALVVCRHSMPSRARL